MAYAKPQKMIAVRGDTAQRFFAWPEDFRFYGSGGYVVSSGTQWVRFWVDMNQLQGGASPPATEFGYNVTDVSSSWDQLNFAARSDDFNAAFPNSREPGVPYLQKLDRQIKAANDAGRYVMLTINPTYPTWVTGTTSSEPATGKLGEYHNPASILPQSYVGWFISHLCARYNLWYSPVFGTPANPYGPHLRQYTEFGEPGSPSYNRGFGNPSGAYINGLEVTNEPNYFNWPQLQSPSGGNTNPANMTQAYVASAMLYVAYQFAAAYGWPAIFGPGTLDLDSAHAAPPSSTWFLPFNQQVVAFSQGAYGYPPANSPVVWGFTQHNYGDVAHNTVHDYVNSRTYTTYGLLTANWNGLVWLTEGGFEPGSGIIVGTGADQTQSDKVADGFTTMNDLNLAYGSSLAATFPNYTIWNYAWDPHFAGMVDEWERDPTTLALTTVGAARKLLSRWSSL